MQFNYYFCNRCEKEIRESGCRAPFVILIDPQIKADMDKIKITETIQDFLSLKGLFLVNIDISKDNDIEVTVESAEGVVSIENCIDITKIIEGVFNRDIEDYALTVSSAGLDQPFKVLGQYIKYTGKEVETVLKSGGKVKGILSGANEDTIEITTSKMVKKEGMKKKVQEDTVTKYTYAEVKSCKPIINFK
jgi:ribosome maturation factor RimP